jgi:adenylate cyclase
MGSADRLNYTALGDAINLTSRLVTLNKIYQTEIIVSESVYRACSDKFLFRPLDTVQVRGKHEFTNIYELIAANPGLLPFSSATPEQIKLCKLSSEAYELYTRKDFNAAILLFKQILSQFPQDGMAQIYITRCEEAISKG